VSTSVKISTFLRSHLVFKWPCFSMKICKPYEFVGEYITVLIFKTDMMFLSSSKWTGKIAILSETIYTALCRCPYRCKQFQFHWFTYVAKSVCMHACIAYTRAWLADVPGPYILLVCLVGPVVQLRKWVGWLWVGGCDVLIAHT
jgi:hypothetical protein